MMVKVLTMGLALFLLFLPFQEVFAQGSEEEELERRAQEIYRSLMCPLCPGQTIAESQTELSRQMRELVKKKLRQGESTEEIIQYFASRYGDSILAEPRKKGVNMLLWLLPGTLLALGAAFVYLRFHLWAARAQVETEIELEEAELIKYKERLERELNAPEERR